MQLLYKRSECALFFLSAFFLCLFVIISSDFIESTKSIVLLCRNLLFVYLFLVIILLHKSVRYVSCIMIFIAGFILFNLSRPLLSYFDYDLLLESNKYVFYTFGNETIKNVLSLFGCSLCSCIIGYLLNRKKNSNNITYICDKTDKKILQIVKILVLLCIPGLIYKFVYELIQIRTYGYLSLYMDFTPAPFFARASWGAFNILFPFLFMFIPSKEQFRRYVIFFFLISSVSFLKGTRSTLLAPVLFFVWYYYALYSNKDVSIRKIFVIVLLIALVANVMLLFRGDNGSLDIDIFNLFVLLFSTQGVTYVLVGNYLDYSGSFLNQSHWYILFPIVSTFNWFFNPLYKEGQSVELVQHTLSLDDQIMYSIAPDLYLKGAGYGSSYIAELYALGALPSVILGSLVLGYFIRCFEVKCLSSKYYLYFSWFFIPHLVWMSRSSYFPNVFMFIGGILFYVILKKVIRTDCVKMTC